MSAVATAPEPAIVAKARGAFYTPRTIASFMTTWAIRNGEDRVLEPACGDGVFVEAAAERYRELGATSLAGRLFGVELEANEAAKARMLAPEASILSANFFDVTADLIPAVDAVVGNPPYIRYHGFNGDQRTRALKRVHEQGLSLSNLASSWAHFLVHSAGFLRPGGRLALVLPAELLTTDYASPIRAWLLERFSSVAVVTFDRMAFANAEVDALLLLASDDDGSGLRVLRVGSVDQLDGVELGVSDPAGQASTPLRWGGSLDLDANELYTRLLAAPDARRLGALASVDIGVVTGANRFFVLDPADARRRRLPQSQLLPIVESASAVDGLSVYASRTRALLHVTGEARPKSLLRYIREGEEAGVAGGYKCRMRTPWYRVPLPRAKPHAFLAYMNHLAPRLLVNRPRAWSTNLLHGVTFHRGAPDVRAVSAAMLSATTMLSAEIEGRAYGGGVLKLETKEAERLHVPAFDAVIEKRLIAEFRSLDRLVRLGDLEAGSAKVDELLGIDHAAYRHAYEVFRNRRLQRKATNGH